MGSCSYKLLLGLSIMRIFSDIIMLIVNYTSDQDTRIYVTLIVDLIGAIVLLVAVLNEWTMVLTIFRVVYIISVVSSIFIIGTSWRKAKVNQRSHATNDTISQLVLIVTSAFIAYNIGSYISEIKQKLGVKRLKPNSITIKITVETSLNNLFDFLHNFYSLLITRLYT